MTLPNLLPRCPMCQTQSQPHWISVNIYRCKKCGLLFKHPFPTISDLNQLYDQNWRDPNVEGSRTGGTNVFLASTYAKGLLGTLGVSDFSGLTLLDFGAGRGVMLDALSELGAVTYAVEPFGYNYLVDKGYQVYKHVEDIPGNLKFDGIVSLDVIEHLKAPREVLGKLKPLLREHGWLHLATPNAASFNAALMGSAWREVRNPGHLYFFTPNTLEWILAQCGYKNTQRLKWFVEYNHNPVRKLIQKSLQLFALDGELRYLTWNT